MLPLLLTVVLSQTEPNPRQLELLTTFRQEFVAITPGANGMPATFRMGRDAGGEPNETPSRDVTVGQPFQMARYEVPQNLWQAVMSGNPSRWKGDRNSVEMVSYDEAVTFCQRATELMRAAQLIAVEQVVRLPSEAEWEYAARAGTASVFSFGDDVADLGRYAWFTGNAAGNDPPVGAKLPNPWGLYDVHGYLWEWCADPWHDHYQAAPASVATWLDGGDPARRALRGGSWKDEAQHLTCSRRRAAARELRDDAVGFRCVLAVATNSAGGGARPGN